VLNQQHPRYGSHVSGANEIPTVAKIRIPPWLGGWNPRGFLAQGKLYGRPVDPNSNLWRVQTEESWSKGHASLVTVDHLAGPIAGPTQRRTQFELLKSMAAAEIPVVDEDRQLIDHEIRQAADRAAKTQAPVDGLSLAQFRTIAAKSSEVYEMARLSAHLRQQSGLSLLPACSVSSFTRSGNR
jgi:hypothetical protein